MEKINTVFGGEAPVRTDVFVAQAADITRSRAAGLIENGCVFINGKKAQKSSKVKNGDAVEIIKEDPAVYDITPSCMKMTTYLW